MGLSTQVRAIHCETLFRSQTTHTSRRWLVNDEYGARQWRAGGVQHPPLHPEIPMASKIVPNSTRLWKLFKNAEFRTPKPQDVRKNSIKILKLLSFHNCFTLLNFVCSITLCIIDIFIYVWKPSYTTIVAQVQQNINTTCFDLLWGHPQVKLQKSKI